MNNAWVTQDLPREFAAFRDYHKGATILVCGCGPSLNLLSKPNRFLTIGVNDVGRLFQPDYLFVANVREEFEGDRFRYVEESRARAVFTFNQPLDIPHPRVVRAGVGRRGGTDFSDPSMLHHTGTSPYSALCLAVHMGAVRIGLIGVDFTDNHFFGATGEHPLVCRLPRINQEFRDLYDVCRERGIEVFNLSSSSRLAAFPRLTLAEFESIRSVSPISPAGRSCAGASLASIQRPGGLKMSSWFFREVEQFLDLARYAHESGRPLRLLSAPCSTGEEPYSMAIALLDSGFSNFTIDAVDISSEAIEYAERGIYPPSAFSEPNVPESWLGTYFEPNGRGFEVSVDVRARVNFHQANLLEAGAANGAYDAIFCRHLLLHLDDEQDKVRLCAVIAMQLAEAGVVFPGTAEMLDFLLAGFEEARDFKGAACWRPDSRRRIGRAIVDGAGTGIGSIRRRRHTALDRDIYRALRNSRRYDLVAASRPLDAAARNTPRGRGRATFEAYAGQLASLMDALSAGRLTVEDVLDALTTGNKVAHSKQDATGGGEVATR